MGNNIESWKTKKIKDLVIPLSTFYGDDGPDESWQPDRPVIEDIENNNIHVSIDLCEDGEITGIVRLDNTILVDSIKLRGEGSGTTFFDVIEPALQKSTGELEAVLIWESSDITRLKAKDGLVKQTDVEL